MLKIKKSVLFLQSKPDTFQPELPVLFQPKYTFDNFTVIDTVDARLRTYIEPYDSGCLFGSQQAVTVTVYNFSCNDITNIPITCDIIGPTTTTLVGTVTDIIAPDVTASYTFPTTFSMITTGTYDFETYIDMPDWRQQNDTIWYSVDVNQLLVNTYPYIEDFDDDDGLWIKGGGNAGNYWEWDTLTYLNGHEGNGKSWYIVRDGSSTYTDQWLISPVFDLTQNTNPVLSFDAKYGLSYDNCDRAVYVQYSTDGGTAWTTLGTATDTSWYDSGANTCWPNTWAAGTVDKWTRMSHDLCVVSGYPCVKLRWYSDDLRYGDRFAIDNIMVSDGGGDDLQPLRLYNPHSGTCSGFTDVEKLGVLIQNNTCRKVTNLPVQFEMTGPNAISITDTIYGPINPFGRYYYPFKKSEHSDFGTALQFDGSNDRVTLSSVQALGNDYTIEYWVKRNGADGNYDRITSIPGDLFETAVRSDGSVYFYYGTWRDTGYNLSTGTWTHLSFTSDGTTMRVYINGNYYYSVTGSRTISAQDWYIGGHYGGTACTNISLDEVRIWDVARTNLEIKDNMFQTLTGAEANLVSYYDMEDGTGSPTLTDRTVNVNHGTLTNMDTATDWVATGAVAKNVDVVLDLSNPGTYTLELVTGTNPTGTGWDYINDTNNINDTITEERYNNKISTFPYTQDFETGNAGWASHPLSILRRYWTVDTLKTLNGAEGNGKSWYLTWDGSSTYNDLWVESPEFDFTTLTSPMISFDVKYSLGYDNCDRAIYMQYSTNGGANWATIGVKADPDWYISGSNTC